MTTAAPKKDFTVRFNAFVARAGLVTGLLLLPFLFEKVFAVGPLRASEWEQLTVFGLLLLSLSAFMLFRKSTFPPGIASILLSILFLVAIELTARISLKFFAKPATLKALREQCNYTYPDSSAYTGHPFIQFTGKPSVALQGTRAHGKLSPYNNFGFVGKDFYYRKPDGVTRVACLGESTTEDGYPAFLEKYLNAAGNTKYEVLNFGHAYWTTNHSLVNFMLNVTDFAPDVVVIHHGWNEERARHAPPSEFRGDYSHAYKVFEAPSVADRYPIRLSVIYRMIKFKYDPFPAWTSLASYIHVQRDEIDSGYSNTDELKPYRRNLENIIQVALSRNMRVVLTTLPRSTDTTKDLFYGHRSIDQCNDISREIAKAFGERIAFVDLDSLITGKHNEIFKDLGHVTDAGRTMKAEAIGKAIVQAGRDSAATAPRQ